MSSKKNAFSQAYDLLNNDNEQGSNTLKSSKRLPKIGSMDLSFPDSYNLTGDSIDAFMKIQGRAFRAGPKPITRPLQFVKEKHDDALLSQDESEKKLEKSSQNTAPVAAEPKKKNAVGIEEQASSNEHTEGGKLRAGKITCDR